VPTPRLLFVTHNVPRCEGDAAGSFVLRLAVALQAAGARVDIIAPGAPGLAPLGTIEGVQIERVRYADDARMTLAYTGTMADAVQGSWSGRLALVQLLAATRRAVRRAIDGARREGAPYDVVHVHWWFPSGLALWRAHRAGDPPRVITMHGSDVRLAEHFVPAHPVMRSVLGEYAACTAVSSWLAAAAQRIAPTAAIEVAPMPVDTRHFGSVGHDAPRQGLLFVGRLNAQKGLRDLLSALALPPLATAAPSSARPVTLDVVGEGPDREALQAHARALGVDDRVRWLGHLAQPDLVPRYRDACAVVMPSRGEGLGLVAVEAQLCGTPVVAYRDGGLPDVVRDAHGGTLVAPGDVPGLAAAVAQLIATPENVRTRGRAAWADMHERFTPEAVAARYLAIYRRVLASPGPA